VGKGGGMTYRGKSLGPGSALNGSSAAFAVQQITTCCKEEAVCRAARKAARSKGGHPLIQPWHLVRDVCVGG